MKFFGPFQDAGELQDLDGKRIHGSDPHIIKDNGVYHLFYTFGPTLSRRGSPGIYHRTSNDIRTGYSKPNIVLRPSILGGDGDGKSSEEEGTAQRAFRDHWGVETFTCCQMPSGVWVGLYCGYPGSSPSGRHYDLYLVVARDPAGPWLKIGPVMGAELHWEQPYTFIENGVVREEGGPCEPGMVFDRGMLLAVYAAKSKNPDGWAWRMGAMASPNGGQSWLKHPQPVITPIQREEGYNSSSHCCLLKNPDGNYNTYYAWSGKVAYEGRGIREAYSPDLVSWEENGLVLPNGPAGSPFATHVGGPSVLLDDSVANMVYHGENVEWPSGRKIHSRHMRLALPQ